MARIMDYSYRTSSHVTRHRPDSLITRPHRVGFRRWVVLCVPRCLVLLAATHVVCASAQEPITGAPWLSLLDAYQIARDSDPNIAIARYRVDGAVANRDVAKSKYFPQISLFGDWSQNKVNYQSTALTQLDSQFYSGERYGLQLRSPLINVRHYREYERQDALVGQSEEELAVAETELLAEVVEAYLSVLLAEETALQFESELSALEQQLEEANALYNKSLPVTQVLETQTRTDSLNVLNARGRS